MRATHEERAAIRAKAAAEAGKVGGPAAAATAIAEEGEHLRDSNEASPFACISSTMGWETFHLVHMLWLSQLDVPDRSETKDWELQVRAGWRAGCACTLLVTGEGRVCVHLTRYTLAARISCKSNLTPGLITF